MSYQDDTAEWIAQWVFNVMFASHLFRLNGEQAGAALAELAMLSKERENK